MRLNGRLLTNLIAVLVLGVVMVGWVVTQIINAGVGAPFTVTADFAASGGVFTNQEVTYRGVVVGRIGALALNDDGVDIQLLIDPDWSGRIPTDVMAAVQSKSAVGEQFVNLTPLSDAGPTLEDGDVIARELTALPVDFQDLLRSLEKVLADVPPEQTRRLIENLALGLEGRSQDISRIIASLGTLAEGFASVAPEQRRLLQTSTEAGTAFLATKDEFAAALSAADDVLEGIGDEPEELRRLFAANDRFAREGIALLARRGDDLAGGIGALADLMTFQRSEGAAIARSLEYVPQFLHAVEDASIPWRSPDGREFYRIRIGLVVDNVRSSWPCKYRLPEDYERQPHVRTEKNVNTEGRCEPAERVDEALLGSLVSALEEWADTHQAMGPPSPRDNRFHGGPIETSAP